MSDTPNVRADVTVVDGSNFHEYVDEKLGVTQASDEATDEPATDENLDPEKVAEQELAELEAKQAAEEAEKNAPKEGDTDGSKVFFKGKWVQKHDFQYRLHLKTQEVEAAAAEKVSKIEAEAKTAKEELEAAKKRAKELQDKYEPPKSEELGPEPLPEQFTDTNEYRQAIKEWTAENTRRELEAERANAERVKSWNDKQEAIRAEMPDYDETIANSTVQVSDQMRDAIIESDLGPKILVHLAKNPDVAEALGEMTVGRMLRELGKLEAQLGGQVKPESKSEKTPVAEISKAPAPISPLKATSGVSTVKVNADGEFYGTYEEYKAARKAGKIK